MTRAGCTFLPSFLSRLDLFLNTTKNSEAAKRSEFPFILSRNRRDLVFNFTWNTDPPRSIQYLQRDKIAFFIIIQNHAWPVFIALGYMGISKDDGQGVGGWVVSNFHERDSTSSLILPTTADRLLITSSFQSGPCFDRLSTGSSASSHATPPPAVHLPP